MSANLVERTVFGNKENAFVLLDSLTSEEFADLVIQEQNIMEPIAFAILDTLETETSVLHVTRVAANVQVLTLINV